jgi:hypothetical protein
MEKPKLIIQSINDQKMGEIQGQTVVEPGSGHKGKSFKFLEMFYLRIGPFRKKLVKYFGRKIF